MQISKDDWIKHFPYSQPREIQEEIISTVINKFKDGNKYAVIECGTGVGKSAIGFTIAKYLSNNADIESDLQQGTYFLTTQKILQEQYNKDFKSKGLKSLSSSSNYVCDVDKKASCKEIQTALKSGSLQKKYDCCGYKCKYKIKKKEFIENVLGITNFSYFLTEKNYSQKLPNKKVLVIDEAHNLESELTRFIEISISEYFAKKILKINIPKNLNTQHKVYLWIKNEYLECVNNKLNNINNQLSKLGITSKKLEEFKKITNHIELLSSHSKKITEFIKLYEKDNWVFDITNTNEKYRKFVFKPIDISSYAKEYILNYADYVIFMSATIVSHEGFCISLGLPFNSTTFLKKGSPFDSKNKPIIYSPAGSMSFKNINDTLPKLVEMIKLILNNHKNQKGIIHTHSNKIANYIIEKVNDKRLILATGVNRDSSLQKHINSSNSTVLLSPSMAEGVDLKGKLSEFQILCKIPYPYLGDKVTKKKMNKWKWWYDTQTARTIIQSLGRSIRNEDDTAVTYILDEDWDKVKRTAKKYFPEDFFENYHEY